MAEHSIPCDTLWLDIEYSDGKRYFAWDSKAFPTPRAMLDTLISHHRKLVTIIDPHVKQDEEYFVYA
jgi:alpha 1,3-glucosidase